MRKIALLAATALVGGVILPVAARAQADPSAPVATGPTRDAAVAATTETATTETAPREVVVTGSRIVQPAYDGVVPGAQVSGEQIERRAFTNALDAITDVPFVGTGASANGINGGQPSSLGQAYVDLFDLGSNRTLTLLNGRRYVSGNSATLFVANNVTGSQVDLSAVPAALIERTDVVTVGGAVAYGSDAVAGVVNVVLKDHLQGITVRALSGLSSRGDAARQRLSIAAGRDIADGRGNLSVAVEYDRDDALTGDHRDGWNRRYVAPSSFRNGGVRNPAFRPALDGTSSAFIAASSDLAPTYVAGSGYRGGSLLDSFNGAIFSFDAPGMLGKELPSAYQGLTTTDPNDTARSPGYQPNALWTMSGTAQLVPGRPVGFGNGCRVTDLTGFCAFAPVALPGTRASAAGAALRDAFDAAVIARYAPQFGAAGGSVAQRDLLALNLLQANLPTPREYLARHPGTDMNAFIGTFIRGFLTAPSRDATTAGALPLVALPLQFDPAGGVRAIVPAVIADPAATPSTAGAAVGGDAVALDNTSRYRTLRAQQDRVLGTLLGHIDLADELTLYAEGQYARVRTVAPRTLGNYDSISNATAEGNVLTMQLANPFLNEQARGALKAAGVTDRFLLSRRNQDLYGDHPLTAVSATYRGVVGARGSFTAFGKGTHYDASLSYGRNDLDYRASEIRDIEYALAADAVRDAGGHTVCRAQTVDGVVGTTPRGITGEEIVRERDAAGRLVERRLRRTVTAAQVAGCRPMNLFGYGQMSADARAYVMGPMRLSNRGEMFFAQGSLAGSAVDLPGGALRYALLGEYRRERLDYHADDNTRTGGTRFAALASTEGHIRSAEFGGEASVPLLGDGFSAPLLRSLTLDPGIRFVRQGGAAPDVQLLDGSTLVQQQRGRWSRITSMAGTWRPFEGLLFRGNVTRSIRQPNITELFLGGQAAFTTPTDPCGASEIGQGTHPENRLANCRAAVIAAGLASDAAGATRFLEDYDPSGARISGTYNGSPGLRAEQGHSWTAGAVLTPGFLPRLRLGADFIHVRVDDQIIPTDIDTAMQLCLDSPGYPDTSQQIGVNTCRFFRRNPAGGERAFEIGNGFALGFINQGKLQVEAVNATLDYAVPLGADTKLTLYANVYRLFHYLSAPDNDLATAEERAGDIDNSKWRTQIRPGIEHGGFFAQWVWNWRASTRLFSSGARVEGTDARNEVRDLLRVPGYSLHDASLGYAFGEGHRFGLSCNVSNVFDKLTKATMAQSHGFYPPLIVDDIGRRFALSVDVKW